jgi:hypothetical protein
MKQKLLFVSALFLVLMSQYSQAQTSSSDYLVRATTAASGNSANVAVNNKSYLVQQSIGQASVAGTFYDSDYILRQGFIQPNVLAKIRDVSIPLSLQAIVYPNPFIENITISFSEQITSEIEVVVFDLIGRQLFSKSYAASETINLQLKSLPAGGYIIRVMANRKQFIKNILKK